MNKTIQILVEAIKLIPRQFYANNSGDNTGLSCERFASQLTVRYRKVSGAHCRTETLLPTSEIIEKFACTPEKKAMLRKLAVGISSVSESSPCLFMEQSVTLPLSQVTIIELMTECKLKRGAFYWDFFKLHFLVEQTRTSSGIYFIINHDVDSIQKKICAYYERGFYVSLREENIFFLIKKDYGSQIVILNSRGDIIL